MPTALAASEWRDCTRTMLEVAMSALRRDYIASATGVAEDRGEIHNSNKNYKVRDGRRRGIPHMR
jgi:hypothetical protein